MIDTISVVNREVAKSLNLKEELVKSVNAFYWKETKGIIAEGNTTCIWLKNIGTLVVSRNKLRTQIKKIIKQIRSYRVTTKEFRKVSKEESIENKLSLLRKLLERRNDIAIEYKLKEDRIKLKRLNKLNNGDNDRDGNIDQECLD